MPFSSQSQDGITQSGWGCFTARDCWVEHSHLPRSAQSCLKEQSSLANLGCPTPGDVNSLTTRIPRRESPQLALHQYPRMHSSQYTQAHTHVASQKYLPWAPYGRSSPRVSCLNVLDSRKVLDHADLTSQHLSVRQVHIPTFPCLSPAFSMHASPR